MIMDALNEPDKEGQTSLEKCIYERHSKRSFSSKNIDQQKISQLLWAGQGMIKGHRASPSAGATYPLTLYIVRNEDELLKYNPQKHALESKKKRRGLNQEIAQAALSQMFIAQAPIIIIICANYHRTTQRYNERGKRYVLIEVGHCAQNILLEATALNLVSVPIGAFLDASLKDILDLPEDMQPIYILPIGYSQ
jgi:SagB-type dehydrogenase family enzyme